MKNYLLALGVIFASMVFVLPTFASTELAGTSRDLVSYNGTGATGTLEFTQTTVLSKFCNTVTQGYVYSSGTIVASGAGMSTLMYCEGLPMTLETNFTFTAPASILLSGGMLTITTDANLVYVFEKQLPALCTLEYMPVCGNDGVTYGNACAATAAKASVVSEGVCPSDETCIQKFDGCNTCMRMSGTNEWACTKMFCETPEASYCIATSDDEPQVVGGDKDTYGCIGSAGFSWSQSQQACIRVWENTGATALEVAYDFAFNQGMTTMDSITTFRAEDLITRQESAKMFMMLKDKTVDTQTYGMLSGVTFGDEEQFDVTLKSYIYNSYVAGIMQGSKGYFMPNETLTKGQAFAVLMRIVDGKQSEPDTDARWMPYVVTAKEKGLITFPNTNGFNDPISRGELIMMAHTISQNASVSN